MYQRITNWNRYFANSASITLLLSLVFRELQHFLGLDTVEGLVIFSAVLAGSVLASKGLERLAFHEACIAVMGVDLEVESKRILDEEIKRRREDSSRRGSSWGRSNGSKALRLQLVEGVASDLMRS